MAGLCWQLARCDSWYFWMRTEDSPSRPQTCGPCGGAPPSRRSFQTKRSDWLQDGTGAVPVAWGWRGAWAGVSAGSFRAGSDLRFSVKSVGGVREAGSWGLACPPGTTGPSSVGIGSRVPAWAARTAATWPNASSVVSPPGSLPRCLLLLGCSLGFCLFRCLVAPAPGGLGKKVDQGACAPGGGGRVLSSSSSLTPTPRGTCVVAPVPAVAVEGRCLQSSPG